MLARVGHHFDLCLVSDSQTAGILDLGVVDVNTDVGYFATIVEALLYVDLAKNIVCLEQSNCLSPTHRDLLLRVNNHRFRR